MSDASLPPAPDHTGIELTTTLSLSSGEQRWGSERRMALLAAIDTEGSISAAARKVGLSYKAAWDAVDMMNSLAGGLLVERITGGKRGGGALLTTRARELVAWAVARATSQNMPIFVAIADADGHLLAFERMQGAYAGCVDASIAKARSSALFNISTKDFYDMVAATVQAAG